MATFITIGYGDRAGYERTDPSVREAAHEHDARLRAGGGLMGMSELPIAGFAVIEAASIEEAARLVSETPCAVAQGVVEVWPLESRP